MRVVVDIEANALKNPSKIWLIICKDIDSGKYYTFYPYRSGEEMEKFRFFAESVSLWIGHNYLGYDLLVLKRLVYNGSEWDIHALYGSGLARCIDTLVVSKLVDFS